MSYLVLARKYRPVSFDQVVGQTGVVRTLKNALELDRVAHAYLFTGARGVGKTTVARLLAKALNCEKGPTANPDISCSICQEIAQGSCPDVFEIDGASNTGVDDVRQLRDNSQYMPARSRYKIYIIDEVHMLSTNAFNALLKTLEEPPGHVKFIFATTEPHKIPLTVLSRCQRFDFKRIPSSTIMAHLQDVLAKEGMAIDPDGLRMIARQASGSMRDALSLTDQVLAFGGDQNSVEQVRQALGLAGFQVCFQVVDCIVENRPGELMQRVEDLFDEGHDLGRFVEGLLWHIHHLILFRTLGDVGDLVDLIEEERQQLAQQAKKADELRWHQIFDVLTRTAVDLAHNPYPRLVLETSLLRLSAIERVVGIDELLAKVEKLSRLVGPSPTDIPPEPAARQTRRTRVPREKTSTPTQAPTQTPNVPAALSTPAETPSGPKAWERLVDSIVQKRPSLGSFLSHAHVREVRAGLVSIAFEPKSFFADQMKVPRNQKELERFCTDFFGTATQVQIGELAKQDGPSLAQVRAQATQQQKDEIRQQALEHPMVQEAIRVFGVEADKVKTQSRDG